MGNNENKYIFNLFLTTPINDLIESKEPVLSIDRREVYSAPISTDTLKNGIVQYLAAFPEASDSFFRKVETDLKTDNPVALWILYSVIWSVQYNFSKKKISTAVPENVRAALKEAVFNNEKNLRECKVYQGANNPGGLYDEIIRTNNVLIYKFKEGLL